MLQLNTTIYTISTRFTSRLLWRLNASLTTNAAAVATESVNSNVKIDYQLKKAASNIVMNNEQQEKFKELKENLCNGLNVQSPAASKIGEAQNVHDLLEVMKTPLLSQKDITKSMKTITEWVNQNNKHRVSDIENYNNNNSVESQSDVKKSQQKEHDNCDISQYYDFSTSQMIKEINKLSQAGNRNVQALNYMFQNIVEYNEELHPGACSSLMYSMSNLSYSDERLFKRICNDLINNMTSTDKKIPAVTLLSIVKSMSMVRYKNNAFLDHVCHVIAKSTTKYNIKQLASILLSFASLGYDSEHVNKIIELYMSQFTMTGLGHTNWLNLVWSLIIFKRVEPWHIASVLNDNFVKKLIFLETKKPVSYRLKLQNINGYALYAAHKYNGPFLSPSIVPEVVSKRSKQKELYVRTLEVTLKNMLPSPSYYTMNIDTKMGFLLDAVLYMDRESNSVPVDSRNNEGNTKIGIIIVDYYDMCLGDTDYQGLIKLYINLLTLQKYEVLCIPYQHFGIEDKMEKRVSYLRRQLWNKYKQAL